MWLHDVELSTLGFRRKGDRYWRCERRFGLDGWDHLSVWSWSEQRLGGGRFLVELTEFHVTFYRRGEHLHFYYHEVLDDHWQAAGHTSRNEIRRLGLEPDDLRGEADTVARAVVEALGGVLLAREERPG